MNKTDPHVERNQIPSAEDSVEEELSVDIFDDDDCVRQPVDVDVENIDIDDLLEL